MNKSLLLCSLIAAATLSFNGKKDEVVGEEQRATPAATAASSPAKKTKPFLVIRKDFLGSGPFFN